MRMTLRSLFASLLLTAGSALFISPLHTPTALLAQEGGEGAAEAKEDAAAPKNMAKEVERIAERIVKRPDRLWVYAYEMRMLAGEEAEERQALAGLAANLIDSEDENVRLAGAQLVLSLGGDAASNAHEALLETIAESENHALVAAAAKLLGRYWPEDFETAGKAVREAQARAGLPAEARVALAETEETLLADGAGIDRLKVFAASDDRTLVAHAALALAGLGRMDDVRGRIATLAKESGELAVAARLLLESGSMRKDIAAAQDGTAKPGQKPELVPEVVRTVYANFAGSTFDHGQDTFKLTPENLVDNAGRAMALSLDQFSAFMTADELRKMSEDNGGSFQGVGAYVTKGEDDPCVKVSQPIYSGPAYKAGLRSGDYIWEAQVGNGTRQSLVGMEVEDVVKILRGPAGTKVKIWVKRPGVTDLVELELTRAEVKSDTALETMMPGDIGYVRLTRFGTESDKDMRESVRALMQKGMKALVLDLRDNPGGDLRAVLNIADMFLPKGAPITRIQGVYGDYAEPVIYASERAPMLGDAPMAVIIDRESASGSELLSGTLKDNGRAVVIGEKSFGKGIGQGFYPLTEKEGKGALDREAAKPNGRILKMTVFNYYILPSGISIDRKDGVGGVTPNIECFSPLLSSWEYYQLVALRKSEKIDRWVRETWAANKAAYMKLADYDNYDFAAYPEFEKLYASLGTPLTRDAIRQELRIVVRTLAADERAEPFHQNYENDHQLQRAIIEVAAKLGLKLEEMPNYAPFLKEHTKE